MKFLSCMHTHTVYGDGTSPIEDTIKAAVALGYVSLGFSEHAPAKYDTAAMADSAFAPYMDELAAMRQKYSGQIEIYRGLEVDALQPCDTGGLDYWIGSAHYVRGPGGTVFCIDGTPRALSHAVAATGSGRAVCEKYYQALCEIMALRPTIIGHMDLVTKHNAGGSLFDGGSEWYRILERGAAEAAAACGGIVEVNTGGMRRGYTDAPYPSLNILGMLRELNVPVTLSWDAHAAGDLGWGSDAAVNHLRSAGYKSVMLYSGGGFAPIGL